MVLAILAPVDVSLPHPGAVDPLIGEARERMRRRRAALVVLAVAFAAALTSALWPSGAPPAGPRTQNHGTEPRLAHVAVPLDGYERQWRRWVLLSDHGPAGGYARPTKLSRMQRHIRAAVAASGADVVRLKVWNVPWTPVELVVATNVRPAAYLRNDLGALLARIHGEYRYVKVVDGHGNRLFENYYRTRDGHFEGMVGVPARLRACSPVSHWGPDNSPPCPVK